VNAGEFYLNAGVFCVNARGEVGYEMMSDESCLEDWGMEGWRVGMV